MANALVREAAQSHATASRRGLLERLFALAFEGLVYPQIWEDPAVDLEALELAPGSRMIAIASGGCNVLSYLAANPARVIAVDLNPAHLALLRLKLAALRTLEAGEFRQLFADAANATNVALYDERLAPVLDPTTRRYWESRTPSGRRRISWFARGFYRQGLLGRFIAAGHLAARLHGVDCREILEARDLAEQRRWFDSRLAPLFDKPWLRAALRMPVAYFGLGIPPAQCETMLAEGGSEPAHLVRARLKRLACGFPLAENYFARQAFGRAYGPGALPPYLEAGLFSTLSARAGRIESCHETMTARLAREPAASLDAYVLLDAQDWMNERQLTALWAQIARTATRGARVIFRTAGETSPLPARLPPGLLASWTRDADRSAILHERDRSAIYGGFHLYRRSAR
ncbi:DUF3419 family protein [Geminicoccaceae bacterium 1502E]|nr:DUF3419 family protein [Geminicoccaceae bacterium 1502E]